VLELVEVITLVDKSITGAFEIILLLLELLVLLLLLLLLVLLPLLFDGALGVIVDEVGDGLLDEAL
jgi:hypothetical protein